MKTMDDMRDKVSELLNSVKDGYLNSYQNKLMFKYHNTIFPKLKQDSLGCMSCRIKVYNRLVDWLKNNNL